MHNLFAKLPPTSADDEQFCQLFARPGLKIERITSTGQASPDDFWFEQPDGEWILLVQGEAKLRIAGEAAVRHLKAGDFFDIPARTRHRVEWTPANQITIWLAIHYVEQISG